MNYTGDKICFLRKERKMSQEKLAELIGVSRQTVYKWEYGIVQPSEDNIKSLSEVFDVEPSCFYADTHDEIAVTASAQKVSKKLKICAIILGVLFAIGLIATVLLGYITLTPNQGFMSKNYDGINVSHFFVMLAISIALFISDIIIISIIIVKKCKCKPDVNLM
ncbi:MAG: helix-turn-helix transcriptional regulator [Roseburia sp.]|nr:helix-turn-helix transcriptional regulator [Roseburia sp.]